MFFYLPALVTYFAFCTIGIAYFTYIHYRYVQLGHLFYVLNLGILIDLLPFEESKRELLLVPLMVLFAVESYFTVDPLTYTLLRSFDAGNGPLVSTREYWYITIDDEDDVGYYWEASDEIMSQFNVTEGVEYNRECLGLQKALEKSLASMDITPKTLVVIDRFGAWDSLACSELFGFMDTKGYFWDSVNNTVTRSKTSVPLHFGFSDNDFDVKKYDKVYYIELKLNDFYEDKLADKYTLNYLGTHTVGKWSVGVYQLTED